MELIRYWHVVWKRWWLVAALLVTVAGATAISHNWSPPVMYATTFRLSVGILPEPPASAEYVYNTLDIWRSAEYLMDDLASAVRGADFARRVAMRLDVPGIHLAGRFGAGTEHRVLAVSVTWPDSDELAQIADAAVQVLDQEADQLVGSLGGAHPVLRLIDPPVVVPVGRSLKDKLDIPIRLGLALVAGVAAAFLLDYLDTTIRDGAQVEELGISLLGRIPKK